MQIVSQQNLLQLSAKSTKLRIFQSVATFGVILYMIYLMFNLYPCLNASLFFTKSKYNKNQLQDLSTLFPTNATHIVFGIASSSKTWASRKSYVEAWWKPNKARGFVFLEKLRSDLLPWPSSCPPYYVSEDTSKYQKYNQHRTKHAIRMVRTIVEMFKAEKEGVRWYVMMDDDTVIFIDNLVGVLSKYDYRKYYYIGANSESMASNFIFSFDMAFGGGGYALSYPLAKALVDNMDKCIKKYPTLYGSDHMIQSCVADLGVPLTQEKGFHQIDLHGDISGFLSAHPQSPLLSLHHFDAVDPLFPFMDRNESFNHLMIAAKTDESRLFQQTISYFKRENWTLSLSWGYSAQIYRGFHPPSLLIKPLKTFLPWSRFVNPPFNFNTRMPSRDPCEAPLIFFFDSVDEINGDYVITNYKRTHPRQFPYCSTNHSATDILNIRVLSKLSRFDQVGIRRECCEIVKEDGVNYVEVATKCGERLHGLVKEELENTDNSSGEWENVMQRSFSSMDQEVANCNKNNTSIGSGSCRCELRYPESDAVGSTAVTAVITADKIIVANCGDSRAVLCRGGKAIPLSTDHKPDRPDELSRIQAAGGRVIYWDGPRVLGVLAMSRAIGDSYLKPYVSSEPEVTETDRTAEDECLILASDGLWDVVSNETACGVARMCLKAGNQTCSEEERVSGDGSSDKACSVASMLLTKLALLRRSSDNVTVVVIDLKRDM